MGLGYVLYSQFELNVAHVWYDDIVIIGLKWRFFRHKLNDVLNTMLESWKN